MTKYLFSIVFLISTATLADPWMPWDKASDNSKNDDNAQSSQPWMPWGADTDSDNTSINNVKRTQTLNNQLFEQGKSHVNAKSEAYYEGLANYYNIIKNQSDYYGYKSTGSFDYMPGTGNSFPAPTNNAK